MTETSLIRIMIVDDHPVIRNGLKYALLAFDDIEVVGDAESGEEALTLCGQLWPDVVLMDLLMPGMDGGTTTQALKERYPDIKVIALTSFQHKGMLQKVMQAGATGFLLKNITIDELAEAIRAAHAGRLTLAPEAAQMLLESPAPAETVGATLTERQREVLVLIVEGLNNGEIAERLVISLSTARHHVSEILKKLGAANRAEAAALAVQHHLVER